MWLRDTAPQVAGFFHFLLSMAFYFERVGSGKWPKSPLNFTPCNPYVNERESLPWADLTPGYSLELIPGEMERESQCLFKSSGEPRDGRDWNRTIFNRSCPLLLVSWNEPLSAYCKSNSICARYPLVICLLGSTKLLSTVLSRSISNTPQRFISTNKSRGISRSHGWFHR